MSEMRKDISESPAVLRGADAEARVARSVRGLPALRRRALPLPFHAPIRSLTPCRIPIRSLTQVGRRTRFLG